MRIAMSFCSDQIKYKSDNHALYSPCELEITEDCLAFRKLSVTGMALGQVGTVGDLLGSAVSEAARKKSKIVIIPIREITQVETKRTFATALVIVTAQGHPVYTFACTSKKEMERIAGLLKQ